MTLLERAQALELRAKRQREFEAREVVAETIRARTKNLVGHLRRIEGARARVTALDDAGRERSPWLAPPVAALHVYAQGGAGVSVASTRQPEWESFVLALGNFAERVEKLVGQDVRRAKRIALEGISTEDLRGFFEDPSTESQARRLLDTFESLDQSNWDGLSGPELLRTLKLAAAFRADVVRLRETGASEELRRFLALARGGGAELGALTDPLRAELETRKLLGRLRVVLK
jgi:hypothetical protein